MKEKCIEKDILDIAGYLISMKNEVDNFSHFDSDEEIYFSWWIKELKKAGFIRACFFEPYSFELSRSLWSEYISPRKKIKNKLKTEEILKGHFYTPDFMIVWSEKARDIFFSTLDSKVKKKHKASLQYILAQETSKVIYSFVEVKPVFDQNNMTRLAMINIKWVLDKYGEYVNVLVPEKHFKKTFTPERYFFTNKTMKPRNLKYKPCNISSFLKEKSEDKG